MRFMMILKGDPISDDDFIPDQEIIAAMGRYNEEMVNAGVFLDAQGLHPSVKGARVTIEDGGSSVVDGPFAESKELIAGFWMIQARSIGEAIEWAKRCPEHTTIEIRQVFEVEEFGEAFSDELREQESRIRNGAQNNQEAGTAALD